MLTAFCLARCSNGLVCFQDGLAELLQVCDVLAMNKIDDILNESKRQQSYPAINLKNFQIILRKFKSVFALLSPRLLPTLAHSAPNSPIAQCNAFLGWQGKIAKLYHRHPCLQVDDMQAHRSSGQLRLGLKTCVDVITAFPGNAFSNENMHSLWPHLQT